MEGSIKNSWLRQGRNIKISLGLLENRIGRSMGVGEGIILGVVRERDMGGDIGYTTRTK